MFNQKVILGDLPEATYWELIGDVVPLDDLKWMFDHVISTTLKMQTQMKEKVSTWFVTLRDFPDTFIYPRDHYMASLLLNFQNN